MTEVKDPYAGLSDEEIERNRQVMERQDNAVPVPTQREVDLAVTRHVAPPVEPTQLPKPPPPPPPQEQREAPSGDLATPAVPEPVTSPPPDAHQPVPASSEDDARPSGKAKPRK